MAVPLAAVAAALAAGALIVAVLALRKSANPSRRRSAAPVPADLETLAYEMAEAKQGLSRALRHLAVVRYDAFGDMGGHLSWSLALLDDEGDGVVLTAIHGRADTRTYAKNVARWSSTQQLSPEESEAVTLARRA